jgi:hypothetical protein
MSSFVICRCARSARRSVSSADCGGPEECASDVRSRRIALARKELRNDSSKNEHEPTTTRSTSYESGHLIRVFRDIGRIFSLLFLLSHPRPLVMLMRNSPRLAKPAGCHSPKREPHPSTQGGVSGALYTGGQQEGLLFE